MNKSIKNVSTILNSFIRTLNSQINYLFGKCAMKEVALEVDEKKYRFFMEVLKNFDFVNVVKEDVAKKQSIKKIA